MKRPKFSEEQIVYAVRQAESGTPLNDLYRQLGIAEQTFYAWKKKYAHLGVSELRRARIPLAHENPRIWRGPSCLSVACDEHAGIFVRRSDSRAPYLCRPGGASPADYGPGFVTLQTGSEGCNSVWKKKRR
jgi:putative transposase